MRGTYLLRESKYTVKNVSLFQCEGLLNQPIHTTPCTTPCTTTRHCTHCPSHCPAIITLHTVMHTVLNTVHHCPAHCRMYRTGAAPPPDPTRTPYDAPPPYYPSTPRRAGATTPLVGVEDVESGKSFVSINRLV